MKLIGKTLVNLSRGLKDSALGHISMYEKRNGNMYYVYYVEARYFGCKEVDPILNKTVLEERSDDDYHYSLDTFFNDESRYFGWDIEFGESPDGAGYEFILTK